MRVNKSNFWRVPQVVVRVVLLVLIMLQISVLTASASKNLYIRWGIDTSWSGDGGSIAASNVTVTNNANVSPKYGNSATVTITVTPASGYVIDKVEWKDNDSDGFGYGNGTALTPDGNKQVSFQMNGNDSSFQVRFALAPTATNSFIAYYGTAAIDLTAGTAPNWNGGTVSRNNSPIGGSSYQVGTYQTTNLKTFVITPGTSPAYIIASVKYAEARWNDPRTVTVLTTPITLPQDSGGNYSFTATSPKSYIIFVQFVPAAATGGKVGAWYGTNNTADVDTPANANGSGGTVYETAPSTVQLSNRVADSASRPTNGNITLESHPAPNFKIISIKYKQSGAASWTNVTLGAADTAVNSFNVPVAGGNSYVVWVVYASTAATSFSVTGSVATDAITLSCGSSIITPQSQIVSDNSNGTHNTGLFTLSTSINCAPDTVDYGAGATTVGISGNTYTTPLISADSTFVFKFKPIGYKINAYVDSSSPTGSGSITPATVGSVYVDVVKGGSQAFTIAPNTGYRISHVYVTDTNRTYTNYDVAPLSTNTYTFNNIQADGVIRVTFVASVPVAGNDYCQIPPFVQGQTNLSPNVLIIFDNSGSMSDYTYNGITGKNYNCTVSHNSTTNLCNTIYYGYFDPYTMYKTDSNTSPGGSNVYLINNVTLNLSSSNGKSGNYLNYKNMSKVDIVRKVLVGGRITGKGTTTLTGRGTTADKYLYTDNGQWVEYGTGEPIGLIQDLDGKVRFGLEVLGSSSGTTSEGGKIIAKLGSSKATLVTAIEGPNTNPTTNTPMAEALYEAIRYFQAKPSAYNSSTDYGNTTWNPAADPIIQYACQKHFVLMLTDGEPNSNDNLPGLSKSPSLNSYTDGVFNVTTWENKITANDRANNTNSTCSTVSYNNGVSGNTNSEKLEAVAFYAHNTDLRSTTFGNDLPGNQNLTIYPVYAFGSGAGTKTLQMTAKYGGYVSKNGNDATASDGTKYASPDQALEWDKDGNCVPDNYFEGDDGAALESGIKTVMSNILANVASGTAASILSNSEGSGASLLQAIYYPNKIFENSTEVNWIGEMHNLWYYIDPYLKNNSVREDTDSNKILNLSSDKVANFNFDGTQTTIDLLSDTNGDGKTLVSSGTVGLDDVKSIWRAGKQLQARLASTRTIHTSIDGSTLLLPGNTGGGFYADTTRATALQPYLQTANNDALAETNKVINFIRGADQSNYRNRKVSLLSTDVQANWKEWKLGDIISSTPQLQSNMNLNAYHNLYGDVSYKRYIYSSNYSRRGMVYVGANDGMFHAFKLGKLATGTGATKATLTGGTDLGEEQWAYIPRNALPYLKYLADTNYGHLFYADGSTVIADVSINKPSGCSTDYADCLKDTTNGTNWSTVLIGSMGLGGASAIKGGSCVTGDIGTCVQTPIFDPTDNTNSTGLGYSSYFAFDIANQYFNDGSPNSTLNAQPVFKWEFSPSGLGYATSGATIVRVSGVNADGTTRVNKNGKWFAVFASGSTGPINTSMHNFMGKSNQNLKIFVVDLGATAPLVQGTSYWVLDSGITNAFGGNILTANTDGDKSNSSSIGYYQDDVLYVGYTRANSTTITSTTQWDTGGVLRILTKEDPNPANWTVSKVIDGIGPVTGAIDTLQDKNKTKFWLYFGTGRFHYVGDDSSSQQYLFGVQDRCYTTNNVFDKNCDTTVAPGTSPIATGQGGTLSLTNITNQSTTISSTVAKGWYISLRVEDTANLNGAERVTTRASAQKSGAVFYTTLQPTSDVCKYGGTTHLWSVNYENGDIPLCSALGGTTLIQMTTGAFEQVKFSDIFTCINPVGSTHTPLTPPTPVDGDPVHITTGGGTGPGFVSGNIDYRSTSGAQGGTGGDGMSPPILRPTPRKEILHIKEK